ncbi:MAG: hypothetical protein ACREVI_12100 [Steroidobacteraceae bacterium]
MKNKSSSGKHRLTGLFSDTGSAERAFQTCIDRGYEIGQVNVVISESTRRALFADDSKLGTELARHKAEGGELGGPSGGRVGILVTIFAAMGAAVAVPALGFVLAGPVVVALSAAGAAGLAAGLIGALGDWGVPKERIRQYEAAVKDGGILMLLETRDEADARAIERRWKELGGRDIHYS